MDGNEKPVQHGKFATSQTTDYPVDSALSESTAFHTCTRGPVKMQISHSTALGAPPPPAPGSAFLTGSQVILLWIQRPHN